MCYAASSCNHGVTPNYLPMLGLAEVTNKVGMETHPPVLIRGNCNLRKVTGRPKQPSPKHNGNFTTFTPRKPQAAPGKARGGDGSRIGPVCLLLDLGWQVRVPRPCEQTSIAHGCLRPRIADQEEGCGLPRNLEIISA